MGSGLAGEVRPRLESDATAVEWKRTMKRPRAFQRTLLASGAMEAAPALLGAVLVRRSAEGTRAGRIIETEAYTADDPASHSYGRRTRRNEFMFHRAGTAYLYLSYGMHCCLNVVTGREGVGEAVLIRAIEPVEGLDLMVDARGWAGRDVRDLANGPGKVCQAFGLALEFNGADLLDGTSELRLEAGTRLPSERMRVGPRIGITKAADWPRRFLLVGSC